MGFLSRLFGGRGGKTPEELARRCGVPLDQLRSLPISYHEFFVTKRGGGKRRILAPSAELKALQRKILRRILGKLKCHDMANGFERGRGIVYNADWHVYMPVVIKMDVRDFFGSTKAEKVERYLSKIGWDAEAVRILLRLCTHEGVLPQGAPTSPRLSNLVNIRLDSRLEALADTVNANYTRYADDLTFSFAEDDKRGIKRVINGARVILEDEGYALHMKKKLRVMRRHQRQMVTGLVVNDGIALPRETRRRLRAIAHHLASGKPTSITEEQFNGWIAFKDHVEAKAAELGHSNVEK